MISMSLVCDVRDVLRRMLWFPTLMFFAFLFAGPIALALQMQSTIRGSIYMTTTSSKAQLLLEQVNKAFSYTNIAIVIMLLFCAFVAGLLFFSYVHSRRQLDLYHSLPVSRGEMFARHYLAGALSVIIPWLLNLLLMLAVALVLGQGVEISLGNFLIGFGVNLLFFITLYSLTVLANMLGGNGVVAALLTALFWAIGPMLLGLYTWLRGAMQPAWYRQFFDWDIVLAYSSPVARFISLQSGNYKMLLKSVDIFYLPALTALFIALAVLAYRARPSEAAGRALAFAKSRVFIKYPVMLIVMAALGMMLHEIGDSGSGEFIWFIIGVALGGFISAQIMEVIYAMDFRAIKARLKPMAAYIIVFCLLSVAGFMDVIGYNSYIPSSEQVESVEILPLGTQTMVYASIGQYNGDNISYGYYSMSYDARLSEAERALVEMTEDDERNLRPISSEAGIEAVLSLAQKSLAQQDSDLNPWDGRNTMWNLVVRYHLADGSVKTRSYNRNLPLHTVEAELDAISAEEDYRRAMWQMFEADPDCIRLENVTAVEYDGKEMEQKNSDKYWLTKGDVSALVAAYAEELLAMSTVEQRQSMPIGSLTFRQYADAETAETGVGLAVSYSYPVYPEFTRTIAELEKLGCDPRNWQPNYEQAVAAMLSYNPEYRDAKFEYIISPTAISTPYVTVEQAYAGEVTVLLETTDADELRELIEQSYTDWSFSMNPLADINRDYNLTITYDDGFGGVWTQMRFMPWDYKF